MIFKMVYLDGNLNTNMAAEGFDDDFRSLFKTHPSPMWVYHPDTLRFIIVNEAALDLYGYSIQQFARMTVLDIRPVEERQRMIDAVAKRTDVEKAEHWVHCKANGETFDVLTYGREITFNGSTAILAIVQDRSELNAAQRQAYRSQSLLDSIVENLPVGVFVKDMADHSRYTLINEACSAVLGKRADELLGKSDRDLFDDERTELYRQQDLSAVNAGSNRTFEDVIVAADGTTRILKTVKKALPAVGEGPARYLLGISQEITEERAVQAELAHLAKHDPLTGLPNRAFFSEYILTHAAAARDDAKLGLFYIDIDLFKHINDSKGHAAGDMILRQVSDRLTLLVQGRGLVARLGGDEFALVIFQNGSRTFEQMASELLEQFVPPFDLMGVKEYVTCSVGIAVSPGDARDPELLMRYADLALYAAKEAGRSTYRFYETAMSRAAEQRHLLSLELRDALDLGQFELFYQPIVRLQDDEVSGFEALIRWNHPDRGRISPLDFIPVAEETGLIIPIGNWVIREACKTAAAWPGDLKIAVNLSGHQFRHNGLLAVIVAALDESGLPPHRLEIEVTETVLLADVENGLPLLKAIRALGIRLAIDDFGTGYSSLSYLAMLSFDKIKLDRSFVSGIESDTGKLAIVRAVGGIGRGFNSTTLAEGVETEEQLLKLRSEGYSEVQGYLLGRPMPAAAVEPFLATRANRYEARSRAAV